MTLHLRITGLVQGVFFRSETKKKADSLGLTGWVQNCADGSVEVHAEGDDEAIQKLKVWCQHGPAAARVDRVERQECKIENRDTFEIRL